MAKPEFTIEWVRNAHSPSAGPMVRTFAEGASETFKKGNPVIYDDSEDGVVAIGLSSGVPSAQTMLGIALEDATGTTGSPIDVLIVQPGDVFSAPMASDQDTLVAPGQDNVFGELFGIIKLSTTASTAGTEFAVDTGNTNWVRVIEHDPRDLARRGGLIASLEAGDRVLFMFLGSIIDSAGHQA